MLSELLQKYNLKYEELNAAERDTIQTWMTTLATQQLSTDQVKEYIIQMKDSIEADLASFEEPKGLWNFLFRKRIDIYRRARLKNYMLLLAFLTGPEKARKAIEQQMQNIKPKT